MMEKFIVEGANALQGGIEPSGNKNEALPVLAAVLLANETVTLNNVPDILDIRSMCGILGNSVLELREYHPAVMHLIPLHLKSILWSPRKLHPSEDPFCWQVRCWQKEAE